MHTIGLLLAAGAGRRFDPDGRRWKLAIPWQGAPVALHTARALQAGCQHLVVLLDPTRAGTGRLADELTALGAELLLRPSGASGDPQPCGLGWSIAHAARHLLRHTREIQVPIPAPCTHLLIQPADMPWLSPDSVRAVARADPAAPVVQPAFQGQRGHPVRFAAHLLPELAQCQGDEGARHVVRMHPVSIVKVDDPGILRDVDTPADLRP